MEEKYLRQTRTILFLLLCIALMAVFKVTSSVSITLVLSLFIFLLVWPVVTTLERARIPAWLASAVAVLIIVAVMFAAIWFILYTVDLLIKTLPYYSARVEAVDRFLMTYVNRLSSRPDAESLFAFMNIDWVSSIMPVLRSVSSSAISIMKNAVITILLAVFLLLERNTLVPKIVAASAGSGKSGRIPIIIERINRQVSKYLGVKLLISLATGACFYLICLSVKLDFALVWGVLAVILNFIPTFGSIIVTILTIFMAVLQYLPNWTPILIVAIGTIATQMIIGNIIDPRVQGSQLNLSPFIILVGLSIFGYIWGIVGMFLAVPLLSILEIIFANMDSTKGIAIMLSSGASLKKRMKSEKRSSDPAFSSDVQMPDNNTKKS